jgi:osmotically-inducible protein OsmY
MIRTQAYAIRLPLLLSLTLCLAALGACEPQEPEDKLKEAASEVEKAQDELAEAREDVQSASDDLESLRSELNQAEAEVAEARKKLRRRQSELAGERQALDDVASDTAVFRLLQKRLLEEDSLESAAVGADVVDGRVTLRGEVESAEQKMTAGRIAEQTPGVREVVNLIDSPNVNDR